MTFAALRKTIFGTAVFLSLVFAGESNAYALGGWPFFGSCGGCCGAQRPPARSYGDGCCRNRHSFGSLFGWLKHRRGCGCRSDCGRDFGTFDLPYAHHGCCAGASDYGHGFVGQNVPRRVRRPKVAAPAFRRVVPPPGTLGWTYRKVSRPVPVQEHPRTGMLDVYNLPEVCRVCVDGMTGYRGDDGVWHFTSARPLIPGVPHIVRVRTRIVSDGVFHDDVRVVRLIRGRVVDLAY